jgi:uncharacterized damage-inducible protein DinB
MDLKEYIIAETQHSMDTLFRHARAVPEDKLDWKVEGNGRSVLEQVQECSMSAQLFANFLEQKPEGAADYESMMETAASWTTIDVCEQKARANTEALFEVIRNTVDDELQMEVELPNSGGFKTTKLDIMGFQNWHSTYHRGQICFIQTLYGDNESH